MQRQFAIVRLKKQSLETWEFPITSDEFRTSPLAGIFDEQTKETLHAAICNFPFSYRTRDGRKAWTVTAPKGGTVDVWLTSDGQLWIEGETNLNLIYGLYVHVLQAVPDLAVEDCITGVIHNRASLLRLVRRDEEKRLPFHLFDDDPYTTPPLAA
jgi:hypothetical protein